MKLLQVQDAEAAAALLLAVVRDWERRCEWLPLSEAAGRVCAEDLAADAFVPDFNRSTVDGFAVVSADTAAAGEGVPVVLEVAGQVEMGASADFAIRPGACAGVATGAMLPKGADAAVMIEHTEAVGAGRVALYQSAAPGENIVRRGDDMKPGDVCVPRGTRLGAGQVGALAALGILDVPVFQPLRLLLISTGDELVPCSETPSPGQVRDINTAAIAALAQKNGYAVTGRLLVPDDRAALLDAVRSGLPENDVICVSGGSSQGEKDRTREILDEVTQGGVFTHGIAVKPGKPTILGYDGASATVVAGLPGHPAAAITVFDMLFCRLARAYMHQPDPLPVRAFLGVNVPGAGGRSKCQAVRLTVEAKGDAPRMPEAKGGAAGTAAPNGSGTRICATPVYGTSGMISTLAGADGYFIMNRNAEGLPAGSTVEVFLL
ncbi:MAG: molybdopterin molybdotransferase MoeA [Clostridiales Family XIII bacterium]|nr:molybdopterin molybdotransferase MoeA [Clostridiales Family XIII bacterium]